MKNDNHSEFIDLAWFGAIWLLLFGFIVAVALNLI